MTPPFELWLSAFALTLCVETPIYWLLLHRTPPPWWRPLVASLGLNALTHPALWYLFPYWEPYWAYVVVAEACVTLVETCLLAALLQHWHVARHRVVWLAPVSAVLANATSTLVGLLNIY